MKNPFIRRKSKHDNNFSFVEILQYVTLGISSLLLLLAVLENILVHAISLEVIHLFFETNPFIPEGYPTIIIDNIRLIAFVYFFNASMFFVTALGLWNYKEWARKLFIFLLGIGILWITAIATMEWIWIGLITDSTRDFLGAFTPGVKGSVRIIAILEPIVYVVVSGYLIYRLQKADVRATFQVEGETL